MTQGIKVTDTAREFESKVIFGHPDDHWSLKTKPNAGGYSRIYTAGGRKYGHVVAYELYVGPVPEGTEVDHTCRVKWCCNPAHLEAVSHEENMHRARLAVCRAGLHDMTDPANVMNHRQCRPCKYTADNKRRRKTT